MKHDHNHNTHEHSHSGHSHAHNANKKALTISFFLIAGFMFVEFIGGYLTNSLAFISDAGHMLSDAVALGLSLSALIFGSRAATPSKTYGYKRFEILAALLNGIVLVLISVFKFKEAIHRLSEPPHVIGPGMMVISVIGLIINIIVAYILHSQGSTKENLNIRSAFLHVIGDLLGSVGAIAAAILIMLFGWYIADPIASMIVSLLVLYSGWHVLKESVNILMEAKPSEIDSDEVVNALKSIEGIEDIHDLHIWMITSEFSVLTVHLIVKPNVDRDLILEKAKPSIHEKFGIKHATIQLEGKNICLSEDSCN